MRKINYLLVLLLLAIGVNWANADTSADQTLPLGNFEEMLEGGDDSQCYNGSYWMVSPTQFQVKSSGTQIIYTKEQLADMANKEIKGISFLYYNLGAFNAIPRTINVWVKEIEDNAFAYDSDKKAYSYFEYTDGEKTVNAYQFEDDFLDYYCLNNELFIPFDKVFAYDGNKNLLVTITFDGDDTADSPTDIEFYYNKDVDKMAMTTCSDNTSFDDFHDSEDWPLAKSSGISISHASQLAQPLTKFTYQEGTAPVVKPATLSGIVSCGDNVIENAIVVLSSGDVEYKDTTDAEGKYTIKVEDLNIKYALTVTATDYEDYVSTDSLSFASDEAKEKNISLTKKDKPSLLSGKVTCKGVGVADAEVKLTHDNDLVYTTTTKEDGSYELNVVKSEEKYHLTVTATDYEDYALTDSVEFVPGEPLTINVPLIKKDKPSILTGKVTCEGEAVEGAEVKLTYDSKLYYKTKTSAEGTYVLKVVKSEQKYKLTVTSGECEDYVKADSVEFVPGEDMTLNVEMNKIPEPDDCVTLGKYTKLLKEGTSSDCYDGHGYSWAAAPTNLSHKHTGSQIIYTKDQLAQIAGKAINKINFIFYNESAFEEYPRTVNVWVKEINDDDFEYDTKLSEYKFFEYTDATPAIVDYQYDGDVVEYAFGSGEMSLTFDKPINYSGDKNLLIVLTFDGDNTCNPLDFNFFCNNEVKNKAMSYFSDSYSFADFADTEDWPYITTDCVSKLEQPVTRIFFTDAVTGVKNITSSNHSQNVNGKVYNLAGQRIMNGYKGIVIKDGKKIYVK